MFLNASQLRVFWAQYLTILQLDGENSRILSGHKSSTYNNNNNLSLMISNFINEFKGLIEAASNDFLYKNIIATAQKRYLIKHLHLQTLNPLLVQRLVEKNISRNFTVRMTHDFETQGLNEVVWAVNQFKVFAWISVCYAIINEKEIESFVQRDFDFLNCLFPKKSPGFLQYHLRGFDKRFKNYRPQWNQQLTALLVNIIDEEQKQGRGLVWIQISYLLFIKSEKQCYRSPQRCREYWNNHLSPLVNHKKWTLQEDLKLFKCIKIYSLKWSLISKEFMGSRTEHMIKNRYNSLMKKFGRRSQRNCEKKIIHRIEADLLAKRNGYCLQKAAQKDQTMLESKNRQAKEAEIKEAIKQEKVETSVSRFQLGQLDLEEVLFSETIAAIIDEPEILSPKIEVRMEGDRESCYDEAFHSYFY